MAAVEIRIAGHNLSFMKALRLAVKFDDLRGKLMTGDPRIRGIGKRPPVRPQIAAANAAVQYLQQRFSLFRHRFFGLYDLD